MELKDRRDILGSVAALLAAPLVLGKKAIVSSILQDEPLSEPKPRLEINPPAHSVKRRG